MISVIQEIGKTQKGAPKVKLNGIWTYPGRLPIDGMVVGRTVEYTVSEFQAGDKTLQGLESWKVVAGAAPAPSNGAVGASLNDAEMRFISNCVGSAIAHGACKSPSEIRSWYLAAKGAISPAAEPFDE